jgi:hypothetical protein
LPCEETAVAAYNYCAYGFGIASEIRCPELSTSETPASVAVRYGAVPETLDDCLFCGSYYQLAPRRTLLLVKGVARFLISGGSEIVVDRIGPADDDLVRAFLLGSAFGALLQQRGFMALHGSCVQFDDRAIVFLGASGQGKSTLATAFHTRGYKVFADDVTAVTLSADGTPLVFSGPIHVRLLPDAHRMLGLDLPAADRIGSDGDKLVIRIRDEASSSRLTLHRLYVLVDCDQTASEISALRGVDLVKNLLENLYRGEFLVAGADRLALYRLCMQVALKARLYRVTWPHDPARFAGLTDLLESHATSAFDH